MQVPVEGVLVGPVSTTREEKRKSPKRKVLKSSKLTGNGERWMYVLKISTVSQYERIPINSHNHLHRTSINAINPNNSVYFIDPLWLTNMVNDMEVWSRLTIPLFCKLQASIYWHEKQFQRFASGLYNWFLIWKLCCRKLWTRWNRLHKDRSVGLWWEIL